MSFFRFWLSLWIGMAVWLAWAAGLVLLGRWLEAITSSVWLASGIYLLLTSFMVAWMMTSPLVSRLINHFVRKNRIDGK